MRTLASIQKIEDLQEIPGYDRVEHATVLGWKVITRKEEFKVGDKCVYIEIDSQVPSDNPAFEFLSKRKYRVKTIKMCGVISQGLVLPLDNVGLSNNLSIGKDVTKELNITKYDPETEEENKLNSNNKKKSSKFHKYMLRFEWYRKLFRPTKKQRWPDWILKTDEPRAQNMPWVLEKERDTNVYITEKIDGSSSSYSLKKISKFLWFNDLLFTVCSRNVWLGKTRIKFNNKRKGYSFDSNNYWLIANKYDIETKLTDYYKNYKIELLIQGEIIGPKIQKNKYNLNELDFYVFNVYDITNDVWFGYDKTSSICNELNLKMVPIVYTGILNSYAKTLDELLKKAEDKSVLDVNIEREGIVIRQRTDSINKKGLSFKAISNRFLLNYHE